MKRKNIYIILLLSMFALTSCKVGKSYVRPEMALPDSLAQQQDSMSIADEQWQAVYTDSTLRALIDRALEYNKDMLIAASRVKEMAAQKRISVANLLPQLTGKVEAEREVENYGGHSRDVGNTYEAKALLSWELDLWGNLRWKKVAAVAEYLQSVEAQRALRMTIVAEVAQAYYELVALDTELEIVRQTQKAREEGVRLARIRFEGGLTSETSYQQAQVELARTATLVPDLERRISLKENDISFLVGEFPTRIKRVNFLQELDVPESLPVGLPSDLLERRPDVRVAEQQLRAEHARVKVAYTNMFPDFNKIKEVYQLRAKLERSAKGYVDLAQLQYINGVINYMDVLDAQRGYFDAQIGVSNAIRDELIAMVNVYKALGGGWQTE